MQAGLAAQGCIDSLLSLRTAGERCGSPSIAHAGRLVWLKAQHLAEGPPSSHTLSVTLRFSPGSREASFFEMEIAFLLMCWALTGVVFQGEAR